MTPRERVLATIAHREPDRVPWCEFGIDPALAQKILGCQEQARPSAAAEENLYSPTEAEAIADGLGLERVGLQSQQRPGGEPGRPHPIDPVQLSRLWRQPVRGELGGIRFS